MTREENPCKEGLTPECFKKYPKYAKKVFAYKLMQAVIGSPLSADLQKMLWRHLVQVPISWMEWADFIIPDDIPLEEIISDDWDPDDPLPDELTINLNELIPDDYEDGDELPDGVTIEPGTEIPDDWKVGDEIPDGITIDASKLFPDDWTTSDPLPEGIVINIDVILPKVWTVGEDLPFGITVDPDFRIDVDMLETLGIYIEEGKTYEGLFGAGWDPTTELPGGSSWKPYKKDEVIIESAVPPLYLPVFTPGPVHRVFEVNGVTIVQTTLYAENDCDIKNYRATWDETRNGLVGTGIFCTIGITTGMVQTWRGASGHQIRRYFFSADLSAIPAGATITEVKLQMTSYGSDFCGVSVQEGTQQAVMTKDDYSQMSGEYFAEIDWQAGINEFLFNQAGLNFITSKVGTTAKVCIREYDHDHLGNQPAVNDNFLCGCYGPDTGVDANKPQFIVTYEA